MCYLTCSVKISYSEVITRLFSCHPVYQARSSITLTIVVHSAVIYYYYYLICTRQQNIKHNTGTVKTLKIELKS